MYMKYSNLLIFKELYEFKYRILFNRLFIKKFYILVSIFLSNPQDYIHI